MHVGLVLSRKKDKQIVIDFGGRLCVVTVVEIRGDKVRLGFLADPQSVVIHRREVYEAIQSEKEQALDR